MPGWTKLSSTLISSTIWLEPDHVRLLWITMLAMSDRQGCVYGSVPGLAHLARVPLEQTRQALAVLEAPDPDSRTPDDGGRRIRKIDGGWFLINRNKHRDETVDDEAQRARKAKNKRDQRARQNVTGDAVTNGDNHRASPQAEVETNAKEEEVVVVPTASTNLKSSETTNLARLEQSSVAKQDPIEAIYQAYPRHVGKESAQKAIESALKRLTKSGKNHKPLALRDAQKLLYMKAKQFGDTPAGNAGSLTPYPATWFNKGRYLDDPAEWQKQPGGSNGHSNGVSRVQQKQDNTVNAWRELTGYNSTDEAGSDTGGGDHEGAFVLDGGRAEGPTRR